MHWLIHSADFIDYLLRVNKGEQIDGTTLKEFTEVMNDVPALFHGVKRKVLL